MLLADAWFCSCFTMPSMHDFGSFSMASGAAARATWSSSGEAQACRWAGAPAASKRGGEQMQQAPWLKQPEARLKGWCEARLKGWCEAHRQGEGGAVLIRACNTKRSRRTAHWWGAPMEKMTSARTGRLQFCNPSRSQNDLN
jgi:hypothetical protein